MLLQNLEKDGTVILTGKTIHSRERWTEVWLKWTAEVERRGGKR